MKNGRRRIAQALQLPTRELDSVPFCQRCRVFSAGRADAAENDWSFLFRPASKEDNDEQRRKLIDEALHASFERRISDRPPRMKTATERQSTLNQREREVFSKVFETILAKENSPDTDEGLHPVKRASARAQDRSDQKLLFQPAEHMPRSVSDILAQRQAWRGLGPVATAEKERDMPGMERFRRAKSDLHACNTDIEVYNFLDERVFRPFTHGDTVAMEDRNYPKLLCEAMKMLREHFHDAAGAVHVFERAKGYGATSYVLGCSTKVYNEMIACKWHAYRDLQAIEQLLDEMNINGVDGDDATADLIKRIRSYIEARSSGSSTGGTWTAEDMIRLERLESQRRQMVARIRARFATMEENSRSLSHHG